MRQQSWCGLCPLDAQRRRDRDLSLRTLRFGWPEIDPSIYHAEWLSRCLLISDDFDVYHQIAGRLAALEFDPQRILFDPRGEQRFEPSGELRGIYSCGGFEQQAEPANARARDTRG
ncbi:hypothetical protein ACVOMT_13845 [Sphingomonas panni]